MRISVIALLLLGACSAPDWTHETLEKSGFSDVDTANGWAPFRCSKDDSFSTHFTATNPVGQRVSGVVCCGIFKSCTVRF